jgi:hypothetical protein
MKSTVEVIFFSTIAMLLLILSFSMSLKINSLELKIAELQRQLDIELLQSSMDSHSETSLDEIR